jgi:hypothetical protein
MASYIEIRNLFSNSTLRNRIITAVVIAAFNKTTGSPTAADKAWIDSVLSNPNNAGKKALMAVLAANKDASVASIEGATDAQIQTNVDSIVQILIDARAGV